MGVAELNQARALGVFRNARVHRNVAQFIGGAA
jgi:hypothetical protein